MTRPVVEGNVFLPWAQLLEAWLALTRVKYHNNLQVLIPLNQWLVLTML